MVHKKKYIYIQQVSRSNLLTIIMSISVQVCSCVYMYIQ